MADSISENIDDIEILDNTGDDDIEAPLKYSITSYGADYTIDSLVKRVETKDIFVPPFQRSFVWVPKQASRFIESLLLGLPVPGIFLSKEQETQKLLVIDGLQRLSTLQFFYSGFFPKNDKVFSLKGVQPEFEGKTYKTLSDQYRRKLDDTTIHATIIKQDEPSKDDSSIYHIFERLNTGGTLLVDQEIRACIYHGPFNDLLAKLNENMSWRSIIGKKSDRLRDQELIVRFLALYFDLYTYKKPFKEFLNTFMYENKKLKKYSEKELTENFERTINYVEKHLGNNAFKPKKSLSAAVFDAVMVGIATRLKKGEIVNHDKVKEAYESLLKNQTFTEATDNHTSDEEKVKLRIQLAIENFDSVK